MSWTDIAEVIKAIAPVFTAGAACSGAYIGYRGLTKWHQETIGNRRIELAEEVLAAFYQVRDILKWARVKGEPVEQKPGSWREAPEAEALYRDELEAVVDRIVKHNDFFSEILAQRYRFEAYFSPSASKPFDELGKIQMEIIDAALLLMSDYHDRGVVVPAETERLETVVGWVSPESDPIVPRINAVIKQMENICGDIIRKDTPK